MGTRLDPVLPLVKLGLIRYKKRCLLRKRGASCGQKEVPPAVKGEAILAANPNNLIFVVDDDDGFRSYVVELLENAGYRTEEFASGSLVLAAAIAEQPAAVILDVQLPDLNGYEVCRELRDRYGAAVPIIFISGERMDALDRTAGLLLGADDYLVKPVDSGEFIARLRRLVDPQPIEASTTNGLGSLTKREHEVLHLLAQGHPQDEIAHELVISPKTVSTHIQRILGKLEVRSRAQAVAVALRQR
jgi:DNA-binding NarL/FixJ family response regulator